MVQEFSLKKLRKMSKVLDFMRLSYLSFAISSMLVIFSIFMIIMKGFNLGLDFTGGMIVEITMEKPIDIDKTRKLLQQLKFKKLLIQNFGSRHDIIIRIPEIRDINIIQKLTHKIISKISKETKQNTIIKRTEFIGPSIGTHFIKTSVIALLVALISIFFYISIRFEWRVAVGVVFSLIHDLLITMGILSLCYIEIDFTILASLMSVIGYSLNDSIVVFDRIRENFCKILSFNAYEIINMSLTQTLHRTFITSGITLMVIMILYFFGGPILEGFSLTMLIGVPIGTFSSIYVASSLAMKLGINRKHSLY